VICSPNNFQYPPEDGKLPEGVIRITAIANFDRWSAAQREDQYRLEVLRPGSTGQPPPRSVSCPISAGRSSIPTCSRRRTIRRFTWHDNGRRLRAPEKRFDGSTHLGNLFLCGTDQGYVGIIGSIVSGIAMANRHRRTTP
jgi:hypothetical protein